MSHSPAADPRIVLRRAPLPLLDFLFDTLSLSRLNCHSGRLGGDVTGLSGGDLSPEETALTSTLSLWKMAVVVGKGNHQDGCRSRCSGNW